MKPTGKIYMQADATNGASLRGIDMASLVPPPIPLFGSCASLVTE